MTSLSGALVVEPHQFDPSPLFRLHHIRSDSIDKAGLDAPRPPAKKRRIADDSADLGPSVLLADINIILSGEPHAPNFDTLRELSVPSNAWTVDSLAVQPLEDVTDWERGVTYEQRSGYHRACNSADRFSLGFKYHSGLESHNASLSCRRKDGSADLFPHLVNAANAAKHLSRKASRHLANVELALHTFEIHKNSIALLRIQIRWRIGGYAFGSRIHTTRAWAPEDLLTDYLPEGVANENLTRSAQDFYESVHVPRLETDVSRIPDTHLRTKLFSFQKRTVAWLLEKERVAFDETGALTGKHVESCPQPVGYTPTKDARGEDVLVSHLLYGLETRNNGEYALQRLRGGILAEEMGLGKSLELLSLVCLHPRPSSGMAHGTHRASSATLIICPPHILKQWESEIEKHASHLRVCTYVGIKQDKAPDEAQLENLLDKDIVLTTYNVLSSEIHFAKEEPDRTRRHARKYERRRSILVMINWWRVCLDEAQMIESGVSNAAQVARQIPRVNAWAVTGTPMKRDLDDLRGLLLFLHLEPFSNKLIFDRLTTGFPSTFKEIFSTLALRHSKKQIYRELQIPPQSRVTVSLPFTAIEEQHYDRLFKQMCDATGFNPDGSPFDPNNDRWDPESPEVASRMRQWLLRLRQTCLHPEVGHSNRVELRRDRKAGPLRTVDEVLQVMVEQNETALRSEERASVQAELVRGHIIYYGKQFKTALDTYEQALNRASKAVGECRSELETAKVTGDFNDVNADQEPDEKNSILQRYQVRLRNALEIQHMSHFFVGTAYFQIKTNETEEGSEEFKNLEEKESLSYDMAKKIRQELLSDVVGQFRQRVRQMEESKGRKVPDLGSPPSEEGLESRRMADKIFDLAEIMNSQNKLLDKWRSTLMETLSSRLIDQEDDVELTGEEYEGTTKQQDEQYVWLSLLRTAITDRQYYITGVFNRLVEHENKMSLQQAKDGKGHAPELLQAGLDSRAEFAPKPDETPTLRGLLNNVRSELSSVRSQELRGMRRAAVEAELLESQAAYLQKVLNKQQDSLAFLERELEAFRTLMNIRVEFYRQLQEISDTVAPYQEETNESVDESALASQRKKEQEVENKLAGLHTKRRFLQYLKAENSGETVSKECIICRSTIETGVLTSCGHTYCKDCITMWFRQNRNCPTCKRSLRPIQDLHDITYKPRQVQMSFEAQPSSPDKSRKSSGNDSSFAKAADEEMMNEINSIDLYGKSSWGTKVDTLLRHLVWVQAMDAGAKSIIFSQYSDFLDVIAYALKKQRIAYADIRDPKGIREFHDRPEVECFLLHARANSSGLNLVNASHVFICEPLLNAALELQATARIHRIGQTKKTTVWTYIVSNTVEESIYDIATDRRVNLLRRVQSDAQDEARKVTQTEAIDQAVALEAEKSSGDHMVTKGGEFIDQKDLWSCLFNRPRTQAHQAPASTAAMIDREIRADAADSRRMTTAARG